MMKKLPGLIFALAVSALIGATIAPAVQADLAAAKASASREHRIKAAFLYNFAKFTVWPAGAFADARAPLRLCVLGKDPFQGTLAALEGKIVKNRPIMVNRLESTDSPEKCHLLFVSASERGRLGTILKSLRGLPVLVVGDTPDFAVSGGIVRLKTVGNNIRFEINVGAAQHVKLKLDSRLLMLGKIVGEAAPSVAKPAIPAEKPTEIAAVPPDRVPAEVR